MEKVELKKNRHAVFSLMYHLVVVTKYRKKCIRGKMLNELEEICQRLLADKGCNLIEFNGEIDQIHLLIETPPQVQLSLLVNSLKTVTSRLIRKKHSEYLQNFYSKPEFWAKSYCIISTGGASLEMIKEYLQIQGEE
ncbi:MAG: IS200/IS605 family transposase [Halanaerobiales bacterium]|nr:IS200/IS605 family transposase [Halanaerobiales bacterium]